MQAAGEVTEDHASAISGSRAAATLTAKEREVLRHIADGESCLETAVRLSVSPFTVRKHRCHILAKLGLHTTAQLVAAAIDAYAQLVDTSAQVTRARISQRERQVVALIAAGLTSKQIAKRINLSPATVRKHRENVAKKLHVHGLAALSSWAVSAEANRAAQSPADTSSEVFKPEGVTRNLCRRKT
jgi:DNA-binding CsgD family transcriptional regulator